MKTAGMITIGQSPRDDTVPEMEKILGPGVRVLQAGALDGLGRDEVAALAPGPGQDALITRLRDGGHVIVAKQALLERLQGCLDRLAPDVDVSLLLCTGVFPRFRARRPVVEPDRVLYAGAQAVFDGGRLGVLFPIEELRASMLARWRPLDPGVAVAVASPYGGATALAGAADELRRAGVTLVAMSCMGYTGAMKGLVSDVTGVPVLLPLSLCARLIAELL